MTNGDRVSVVPEDDPDLWAIHREMVDQAMDNRARLLEVILSTAANFVKIIG